MNNRKEMLKNKIEEERLLLNQILNKHQIQDAYQQSQKVDRLIEEYLQVSK